MSYSPNFRGTQAKASRQVSSGYVNATGAFLAQGSVVSLNASGMAETIDITSDDSVDRFLGVTAADMPIAASGSVVGNGRVENVTTSFAVGDPLYVNTDGTLINERPDYGVGAFAAGDYVIFIGIVVKNEFNGAQKDFQINPTVVGQL